MTLTETIQRIVKDVVSDIMTISLERVYSNGMADIKFMHKTGATLELRSDGKGYYNGVEIGTGGSGVTDHGLLDPASLLDDDHTQYYNAARHTKALHDGLGFDHGLLDATSLTDDDHAQYYNSVRHTKAVHDALLINADTVDGYHGASFLLTNGANAMANNLNMNANYIYGATGIYAAGTTIGMYAYDGVSSYVLNVTYTDVGAIWAVDVSYNHHSIIAADIPGTDSSIFKLNQDATVGADASLSVERGTSGGDARVTWDESESRWTFDDSTNDVGIRCKDVVTDKLYMNNTGTDSTSTYIKVDDTSGNLQFHIPTRTAIEYHVGDGI